MNKDDLREWINQLSQDNATPAKVLNLNEGASETGRLCHNQNNRQAAKQGGFLMPKLIKSRFAFRSKALFKVIIAPAGRA